MRANRAYICDESSVTGNTSIQDFAIAICFGDKTKMSFNAQASMTGRIVKKDGTDIDISTIGASGTDIDVSDYVSLFGWHGSNRNNMFFTLS